MKQNTLTEEIMTFEIELDKIPISANKILRLHWSKRVKEKEEWKQYLLQYYKVRNIIKGKFVKLQIIVYRKRLQDFDNSVASLKYLIDALKEMEFIVDDNEKWVLISTKQIVSKEQKTKIRIRI